MYVTLWWKTELSLNVNSFFSLVLLLFDVLNVCCFVVIVDCGIILYTNIMPTALVGYYFQELCWSAPARRGACKVFESLKEISVEEHAVLRGSLSKTELKVSMWLFFSHSTITGKNDQHPVKPELRNLNSLLSSGSNSVTAS